MSGRDIVVIGASAGGLEVLREVLASLPADLPAAVFTVVHVGADSPGVLPQVLTGYGNTRAAYVHEPEPIRHGRIYIAPADCHLLLSRNRAYTTRGPRENGFRPAIDPLFRTAARAFGPRVIGVVLSGALDDGSYGLSVIKQEGGAAIVQDPAEALFPSMPLSAIQSVAVDAVLRTAQIGPEIVKLTGQTAPRRKGSMARANQSKLDVSEMGTNAIKEGLYQHAPSALTCPDCGGALWELGNGNSKQLRYRCHLGHGYTAAGLANAQNGDLETALWTALRTLEESAELKRKMANRSAKSGWDTLAVEYEKQASEAERRADTIRDLLVRVPRKPVRGAKRPPPSQLRQPGAGGTPKRRRKSKAKA